MKRIACYTSIFLLVIVFSCKDEGELPSPVISSFTPAAGVAGTLVTIQGSNFSKTAPKNQVIFGTLPAEVIAATSSELQVIVPPNAVTAAITVRVESKTTTTASDFIITPPPTITTFTPLQGIAETELTITGTNFSTLASEIEVKFGTATASIVSASPTEIKVNVPASAVTGPIHVTIGSQSVSSSQTFTLLMRPFIQSLSVSKGFVGDEVILTGTSFAPTLGDANIVYLGTLRADVISASTTELKVTVPPGASDNGFTVVVNNVSSSTSSQFNVVNTFTVSTFAGSTEGFVNDIGAAAKFTQPTYLAKDSQDNLYVTGEVDQTVPYPYPTTNKIRKITPTGLVSTFAGTTQGSNDGLSNAAQFDNPRGIAFDSQGNLYVADAANHRIRKISTGGTVSTFAGSTSGNVNATGINAKFNSPQALTVDAQDNVYVLDRGNYVVRKITPAGVVTTLAGSTAGSADGTGTAAQFMFSSGAVITVDGVGNILLIDSNTIRKITPSGVVTTIVPAGNFSFPNGLTVGPRGDLYVADFNNHRIARINSKGAISIIAGLPSTSGFVDGSPAVATFHNPSALVFDSHENLYIADMYTHRIRKITMQ